MRLSAADKKQHDKEMEQFWKERGIRGPEIWDVR